MQEWLKDKKNLPIIATIGALVLLGSIALILFETGAIGGSAPPTAAPPPVVSQRPGASVPAGGLSPAGAPPPPIPGRPPGIPPAGVPPGPSRPGASAATAAGAPRAPVGPVNVTKGPDPFKVASYRPPKSLNVALANLFRVRNIAPPVYIQSYPSQNKLVSSVTQGGKQNDALLELTPQVSRNMRMSGVIFTDNAIKAVLETNGVSQQVQPGDSVEGGRVVSIQADGLVLRTSDNRLLRVPLSGAVTGSPAPSANPPPGGAAPDPGV